MALTERLDQNAHVLAPYFPASLAVDRGDLMWYDSATNLAKKASQRTDTGSAAGNQSDFAQFFLGFSNDARLVGETTSQRRTVTTRGIADVTCSSRAWKLGELVGVARDSGNSVNYNQQVDVVTTDDAAIGVCILDTNGVASTTVRALFIGKITEALLGDPGFFEAQPASTAAVFPDADTTLTAASSMIQAGVPTAARKCILPAPSVSKGLVFIVVNNSGGAFNINVRDNADTTTIQGVAQNKRAIFFCDGTTWYGLLGA